VTLLLTGKFRRYLGAGRLLTHEGAEVRQLLRLLLAEVRAPDEDDDMI
jgi:hypothetical protein